MNGSKTLSITGDTYQLDTDLSWSELKNAGVRLRESEDQKRHIDVGIFAEGGYAYVNRANPQISLTKAIPMSKAKLLMM